MKEEYKFARFSSDLQSFTQAGLYVFRLFDELLTSQRGSAQWSVTASGFATENERIDREERLRLGFLMSPDIIVIFCNNRAMQKGVLMQIHDPAGTDTTTFNNKLGLPYCERPANISAHMDTFGDRGTESFSQDLVILCELTTRTEALAKRLIHLYTCDGLSFETMINRVESVNDGEAKVWDRWKAETGTDPYG
jgi:hypothetical protein